MTSTRRLLSDPARFLAAAGVAYRMVQVKPGHLFFSQGGLADAIFFLDSGRAKLTVVSSRGREATVSTLAPGDFIGEESLASGTEVILHEKHEFADIFLDFVLLRGARMREDLIDQLFNNSEKRLARTLLLMAESGMPGEPETTIPVVTQGELAEMIGTTRSRVSKFMNKFRKLGYITYNGRIHVHKALLNVVLDDRLPDQTASRPVVVDQEPTPTIKRKRTTVPTIL